MPEITRHEPGCFSWVELATTVISVWEPRQHIGVQVRDEPNTLCWNELYTRDTARVRGRFALVADPQGAALAVIRLEM